jgi:hypothetical protein
VNFRLRTELERRKLSRDPAMEKEIDSLLNAKSQRASSALDCSVRSLVRDVSDELGVASDRVVARIMELRNTGKIRLVERKRIESFAGYLTSARAFWFWGAIVATLFSAITVVSISAGSALYLRYAAGSLLLLFLPGYSITRFLYSNKSAPEGIRHAYELVLSFALSLALIPAIDVILNYTSAGVRLSYLGLILAYVALIFLTLSLWKDYMRYKVALNVPE